MNIKTLQHIEALTQNVVGMMVAFVILYLFGLSFEQSVALQITFLFTSYVRSYIIRSMFRKLESKSNEQ